MKNEIHKHFKFTIGEQYENYEFQLSSFKEIEEKRISYDVYLYTGKKNIFKIQAEEILLYFNADILMKIEYVLDENKFEYLKEQLNVLFNTNLYLLWYFENYMISLNKVNHNIILLYENSK